MYGMVLLGHSWLRWVVLTVGLVLLVVAWRGWRSGSAWADGAERLRRAFLGVLDLQLLLGVVLYAALSPLPRAGWANAGAMFADSVLRFYTVEHMFGMTVAVAVAHIGVLRAKRAEGVAQYRTMLVTLALWLLITLVSIPWPFMAYGRQLFRF